MLICVFIWLGAQRMVMISLVLKLPKNLVINRTVHLYYIIFGDLITEGGIDKQEF